MLYQSEAPYLFDSSKFTREFGFPGTPYADGIRGRPPLSSAKEPLSPGASAP
jgi:hypothetical protein